MDFLNYFFMLLLILDKVPVARIKDIHLHLKKMSPYNFVKYKCVTKSGFL
jgi:hypothetical protein